MRNEKKCFPTVLEFHFLIQSHYTNCKECPIQSVEEALQFNCDNVNHFSIYLLHLLTTRIFFKMLFLLFNVIGVQIAVFPCILSPRRTNYLGSEANNRLAILNLDALAEFIRNFAQMAFLK